MTAVEKLTAIAGVRNCKARYWYFLDSRQWDQLRSVFACDAITDFRCERDLKPGEDIARLPPVEQALAQGDPLVARGPGDIVRFISTAVEHWTTVHHGFEPIIDIVDGGSAKAIWPMFDYIDNGTAALKGYGHYHETYVREDGAWRISRLYLTRIRVDGRHPGGY